MTKDGRNILKRTFGTMMGIWDNDELTQKWVIYYYRGEEKTSNVNGSKLQR